MPSPPISSPRPSLSRHDRKSGQRKLKCQRMEREESKLLIQRTKASLKRIISAESEKNYNSNDNRRSSLRQSAICNGESLANMGISFSLLGIDDDLSEGFSLEPTAVPPPPPTPAPIWETSESSSSQSTSCGGFGGVGGGGGYADDDMMALRQSTHTAATAATTVSSCSEREVVEEVVEVYPGHMMPLRSSDETWAGILNGRTIKTSCILCETELTCLEDAELLACSDCWVFSPIERPSMIRPAHGVCIGVKCSDLQAWLASGGGGADM